MDYANLPLNFRITTYYTPCEHREKHDTDNVCALVSERAQASVGVDPVTCAKCRLDGQVNHAMIEKAATDAVMNFLNLASLGIHRGPTYIANVIDRAFLLSAGKTDTRNKVENSLMFLVKYGRISKEDVSAIAIKHGYSPDHPLHARLANAHQHHVEKGTIDNGPIDRACCGQPEKAPEPPPPPVPIKEAGLLGKIADTVAAGFHAVRSVVDEPTSAAEYDKRRAKCLGCKAVDSKGERLYRDNRDGPTCGEYRLAANTLRDSRVDGCGCYLVPKWKAASEKCPLGYWDD
jgi:hypothetical protein